MTNLGIEDIYNNDKINKIIVGNTIDLSDVGLIPPCAIAMICLLLIERIDQADRKIILPTKTSTKTYLKRMHFDKFLEQLGFDAEAQELSAYSMGTERDNFNTQEIVHCEYRDELNARLARFLKIFENFGLNTDDSARATNIVGELGNNVFDHNSGSWSKPIVGAFIMGQNYPSKRRIEIAVADPGIGFLGSLKLAFPNISTDIEAIKLGLAGNTGRVGENRGNGLRLIQKWTIDNFSGTVIIHSGEGVVLVNSQGNKDKKVTRILGTLAQFVINYK